VSTSALRTITSITSDLRKTVQQPFQARNTNDELWGVVGRVSRSFCGTGTAGWGRLSNFLYLLMFDFTCKTQYHKIYVAALE